MSVIQNTITWVKKNWDIDDDVLERWLTEGNSKRNEWLSWVPNGVYMSWATFSEREKCLMISVGYHQQFKINELARELAEANDALRGNFIGLKGGLEDLL